jgi:demethylmenaquinone methyltransferase/2-methoxy-6-polyprenyl-1,4-benzoquinol methylase
MSRQAFFNQIADSWDKRFQTQALTTFLEQLAPTFGLMPGQKVLDVGTGTGLLIPFLLQAVGPTGQIFAIDYAEKMVKICKSKHAHIPNVTVTVQQVETLDFQLQTFDAVTCFGLFPHLENKQEALRQINRVLKTSGKLIIAHALSSEEIKAHHHNTSSVVAHDELPTAAVMEKLLTQAGFGKIHIIDKPGQFLNLSIKLNTVIGAKEE